MCTLPCNHLSAASDRSSHLTTVKKVLANSRRVTFLLFQHYNLRPTSPCIKRPITSTLTPVDHLAPSTSRRLRCRWCLLLTHSITSKLTSHHFTYISQRRPCAPSSCQNVMLQQLTSWVNELRCQQENGGVKRKPYTDHTNDKQER